MIWFGFNDNYGIFSRIISNASILFKGKQTFKNADLDITNQ